MNTNVSRTVTLLTDFGLHDTYVGQVKGAILAIAPQATLVDLTHTVPAQDVGGGAFLLWTAVEAFAHGTIHLAVVDPGVGSARRAIAVRCRRGDVFVGPDNGVLMPAVARLGGLAEGVVLSRPEFWRSQTSATFHGRDIFGPVAGHLARGVTLAQLGTPLAVPVPLELPRQGGAHGEVIHIDTYGNLVTTFAIPGGGRGFALHLAVADEGSQRTFVAPHVPFYAAAARGALVAVSGSSGLVEIAVRDGSAAALTGAQRGTPIELELF